MSVSHSISQTYSGGGVTPVSQTITATGSYELNDDTICAGSATTTLNPTAIFNPRTAVQACCYLASGNCTLDFHGQSGGANTIALAANTPFIRAANGSTITDLPSGSDTYTFRIQNAGATTITVGIRNVLT